MGIFSSEYEYYAFSQTQPLIEDEDKQDTLGTFVVSAARHDDEEIPSNIVAACAAGLPALAFQYFKYGESKYFWGLPESSFQQFNINEADIKRVLGYNITIERIFIPVANRTIEAIRWLTKQPWYDVNKITNTVPDTYLGVAGTVDPLGFTVYESDIHKTWLRIEFPVTWQGPPNPAAPKVWGKDIQAPDSLYIKSGLWVIYSNPSGSRPTGLDPNLHWPTRYSYVNNYPSADFPDKPLLGQASKFYPIAIFWRDRHTYHAIPEWNKTLNELMRKLNVDADEVFETFKTALDDSNADNLKLLDFFLGFLFNFRHAIVRPYTDPEAKYAFEMVKNLHLTRGFDRDVYEDYLKAVQDAQTDWENTKPPDDPDGGWGPAQDGPKRVNPPQQRMFVSEGNTPNVGGFNYLLSWSLTEKYTSLISHADAESKFIPFKHTPPQSIIPDFTHQPNWVKGITILSNGDTQFVSYLIVNVESQYMVNTPDGARFAKPEGGVWCPISYDLLKKLPFKDKDQILQNGMCSVVYTVIEEEIKWYSSTFWKGMFIILTVATLGILSVVGIAGVLGAMGMTATAGFSMVTLAGYILQFAVSFLVQMTVSLHIENPIVAAIVTSVLTMGIGGTGEAFTTNFNTAFSNLTNVLSFEATSIISLVSKVNTFRNAYIQMGEIDELEQMQEDMTMSEAEQQQALDDAYSGLSTNLINPHMELSKRLQTDGFESPSEFMNRTVKFNPGAELMEIPANFVEISLQLPKGANQLQDMRKR